MVGKKPNFPKILSKQSLVWKYLYKQIPIQETKTMVWKKPNFPKILSKESLVWNYIGK